MKKTGTLQSNGNCSGRSQNQEERLAGNKFHYHETIDRAHLICSMIDDFLIDHPGMEEEQNKWCELAQEALVSVASRAAELSEKLKG